MRCTLTVASEVAGFFAILAPVARFLIPDSRPSSCAAPGTRLLFTDKGAISKISRDEKETGELKVVATSEDGLNPDGTIPEAIAASPFPEGRRPATGTPTLSPEDTRLSQLLGGLLLNTIAAVSALVLGNYQIGGSTTPALVPTEYTTAENHRIRSECEFVRLCNLVISRSIPQRLADLVSSPSPELSTLAFVAFILSFRGLHGLYSHDMFQELVVAIFLVGGVLAICTISPTTNNDSGGTGSMLLIYLPWFACLGMQTSQVLHGVLSTSRKKLGSGHA